jgi:adenylate kinase family enzyme
VKRIVFLDRGGVGRSTLGQQLGGILGTLVTELDSMFWKPGPRPTPEPEWARIQNRLVTPDRWIIDTPLALHR